MSKEKSKANRKCMTCSELIDQPDLASMQCGHPFHYQCLQIKLSEQICSSQYPSCCPIPDCYAEPSMYFMSVVLEEADFSKYLVLEKKSVQEFLNYECPFCEQSFLAFPSNNVHKCLRCYKDICLSCKSGTHPKRPCYQQSVHIPTASLSQLPLVTSEVHVEKYKNNVAPKFIKKRADSLTYSAETPMKQPLSMIDNTSKQQLNKIHISSSNSNSTGSGSINSNRSSNNSGQQVPSCGTAECSKTVPRKVSVPTQSRNTSIAPPIRIPRKMSTHNTPPPLTRQMVVANPIIW